MNKALLCKWSWCFANERGALWKQVINKKYGEDIGGGDLVRTSGVEPLCISFPSLFALAISKDAWVADVWNFEGKRGGWAPCFSRSFNDWEAERVKHLLLKIQTKRAYRDEKDRMIWMALSDMGESPNFGSGPNEVVFFGPLLFRLRRRSLGGMVLCGVSVDMGPSSLVSFID
ncbi:hypothetical protein AAG906_034940 [Vitis piasezkii]